MHVLGRDHALSGALAFAGLIPLAHATAATASAAVVSGSQLATAGMTGAQLAVGLALTAGAGVLPDIDEPGSTIARTFGILTGAFAKLVHVISGGHRKGTHSLLGVAVLTAAAWAAGWWQLTARAPGGRLTQPWHLVPAGVLLALLFAAGFRALRIGGHLGDLAGVALAVFVVWRGWDVVQVSAASRHVPVLAGCTALGMLAHLAGDMITHDGCPLLYPLSRHDFALLPKPVRITTNKMAEHWIVTPLLLAALAYFIWRDFTPLLHHPPHPKT